MGSRRPADSACNDALAELAARHDVGCVATTNAHYAAVPAPAGHGAGCRAGLQQLGRARFVAAGGSWCASPLWRRAAASLRSLSGCRRAGCRDRAGGGVRSLLVAPSLPPFPCPNGRARWSTSPARRGGARHRYGDRPEPHEDLSLRARAWRTIDHELEIIEQLGFAGYFLVVWDLVRFCKEVNIFCQGRGSAANSAVCYALGVTNADAGVARPPVRALPVTGARRPAGHRHRHRERPARGGHPVPLREARQAPHGAGRQRHHVPRQVGDP